MEKRKGIDNLIPFNQLSQEEHREIARKGGKASVKARRQKKALKEQIELLLSLPLQDSRIRNKMEQLGIDADNIDNQMAMVIAMWNKALKGDVKAFKALTEITDGLVNDSDEWEL